MVAIRIDAALKERREDPPILKSIKASPHSAVTSSDRGAPDGIGDIFHFHKFKV